MVPRCGVVSVSEQAALPRMDARAPGPRPRSAARDHAHSAVVKFKIERVPGADFRGFGQHPRNTIADHDIATGEQALVALRVAREPPGKTVEQAMVPVDKPLHRVAQPRLELGGAGA